MESSDNSLAGEYCPYCQLPLILIKKQNMNLHLEVCSRKKSGVELTEECPKGLKCDSTMICHYERYSHAKLAEARSQNNSFDNTTQLSSISNLSMTLLNFESVGNSSEDFAAEKSTLSNKRRKLFKTSSPYSKNLSQTKHNLTPRKNFKMAKSSFGSPSKSSYFEGRSNTNVKMKTTVFSNDSFKENCEMNKAASPDDMPEVSCLDEADSLKGENFKTSSCQESGPGENAKKASKAAEKVTIIKCSTDTGKSEIVEEDEFSCSPTCNNKKSDIGEELTDTMEFEETAFSGTSTQLFVDPKTSTPFPNIQMESGHKSVITEKTKDTFEIVPKYKSAFKKPRQADIGALLFGMKPLEPKTVEPLVTVEKNKENDHAYRGTGNKKKCPFYKKVDGTNIAVDAFSYGLVQGIDFYFLSHFHYDHYMGLTKKFQADIYCSRVTGNLVETRLGIAKSKIKRLPMNEQVQVGNVFVTLLEANHCPGAVLFLFQLKNDRKVLHTGDFRADAQLLQEPLILNSRIDVLYLDTTYLDPNYSFPPQNDVIQFVTNNIAQSLELNRKTLVVTGTYCIGKEKIFMGIAKRLDIKVFVSRDKERVLKCFEDDEINRRITTDPTLTNLHVLPMNKLNPRSLHEYLKKYESSYNRLIAIKPTGWTFKGASTNLNDLLPSVHGSVMIYGVPYSEHSSFTELQQFVETLKPNRIIPTVNVGKPETRKSMEGYLNCWKRR